ncbi:Metallo-peptidase family M12-domain-containing protein [Aspergillus floccosus]
MNNSHFFCPIAFINGPVLYLERPDINTVSETLRGSSQLNITVRIRDFEETLAFLVEENHDITTADSHAQYVDKDGKDTDLKPLIDSTYQITKGSVWVKSNAHQSWESVGWARFAVFQGERSPLFEGTFTLRSQEYDVHIQSSEGSAHQNQLVAYQTSGSESPRTELSMGNGFCTSTTQSVLRRRQFWDDSSLTDTIGDTAGCPSTRQTAYIGVATDCSYTASFDSAEAAHRNILNVVNTASVVFENSFNISLGLRNLTISDASCPNNPSDTTAWNSPCSQGDLNWRLQQFSSWRGTIDDSNAYWTLLTGCPNPQGEVGVSWVGALCNTGSSSSFWYQSGVGANIVGRTSTEWQVFAHESAHTFGAVHDCDSSACASGLDRNSGCCPLSSSTCDAGGQYIMNPASRMGMTRFSPCTIGNVCSGLRSGRLNTRCLVDSIGQDGTGNNNSSYCGNGIVEVGEACDCGQDACSNIDQQCCDPMTCQWMGGEQCDRNFPGGGDDSGERRTGTDDAGGVSNWVQNHLRLVIGLSAGIGGAIMLVIVFAIIICCWRRRKPRSKLDEGNVRTRN